MPKLAVYKFASCDGCQLSLLDCEDELLELAEILTIANFAEATRRFEPGPYDLVLVEGSITTKQDLEKIKKVREEAKFLMTIGACATTGGIQALKNSQSVVEFARYVYAKPEYIESLATSSPISDHVRVDYQLQGCPINKYQLLEAVAAILQGRPPQISNKSVCVECKLQNFACRIVTKNEPCLGPVTHGGCGALCISFKRSCFGCYGYKENSSEKVFEDWLLKSKTNEEETSRIRAKFNSFSSGVVKKTKGDK